MSNKIKLLQLFIISGYSLFAQIAPNKYWIEFTDKENSIYSIDRPEEFLSEKAIQRRVNQNINITENDLPVNAWYVDSLINLGLEVLYTSKWFNGTAIYSTDTLLLDTLHRLSFVKDTVRKYAFPLKKEVLDTTSVKKKKQKTTPKRSYELDYSYHSVQLEVHNCDIMPEAGFTGDGVLIAVLDAGFYKVNELPAFEHLFTNEQIVAFKDFVGNTSTMYSNSSHGMKVLSIIAGEIPGQLQGTAPDADFVLIRTEDTNSENIIEEYNWLAGAEYADSIGADIINSSLGYSTFEDARKNYSYSDMDGHTARITRAADIAASKGMLVITSAGNQGNRAWKYITAPADADSVLTTGAISPLGEYASFSSQGPSFDGRVKPNVATVGHGTFIQDTDGSVNIGSGTSYAAPLLSGMAACLWQAVPEANSMQVLYAIEKSASLYPLSDTLIGYGIPDMVKAKGILEDKLMTFEEDENDIKIFPNPIISSFYVELYNIPDTSKGKLKIYSPEGRKIYQSTIDLQPGYNIISFDNLSGLPSGIYLLQFKTKNLNRKLTFFKQ